MISSSVVSTGTIVATNTGNVTQTYDVKGSSGIGGSVPWTLSTSTGYNKFSIYTIFNSTVPKNTDFSSGDDQLKYTDFSSSSSQFAINGSTYTGANIPMSDERNIWFFLEMPKAVLTSVQKTITVTITAGESQ